MKVSPRKVQPMVRSGPATGYNHHPAGNPLLWNQLNISGRRSSAKMTNRTGKDDAHGSALVTARPVRGELIKSRAKILPMSQPKALVHSEPPSVSIEHAGLRLHSAFQPIISVVHSKIVGHEALIRGRDEKDAPLSPAELFPQLVATLSAAQVNETCTRLHLTSFAERHTDGWLFLNVSPDAMPDRAGVIAQFGTWLAESGVKPHQVVVEIIETRSYDECLLAEAVAGFRDLGCLVAIDDFGAGESNFERVWRLRPDIVKLDRAMITEAASNPLVQRILPGIVSLVHEAGCLVVMEGIETERQALIALESDVDFVQGFYFLRPSSQVFGATAIVEQFKELSDRLRSTEAEKRAIDHGFFAGYTTGFSACVTALEVGTSFHDASSHLLSIPGVQRVYQLDHSGYQVGSNVEAIDFEEVDARFTPCAEAAGANWHRRPYFRRAVENPGRLQISRPYLSIRDARPCVTMSHAFYLGDSMLVLCADLDQAQAQPPSERGLRNSAIIRR
jgi:EAL domain-containing protein (putative c-di-GMP-specific phosphodiesterase class I)